MFLGQCGSLPTDPTVLVDVRIDEDGRVEDIAPDSSEAAGRLIGQLELWPPSSPEGSRGVVRTLGLSLQDVEPTGADWMNFALMSITEGSAEPRATTPHRRPRPSAKTS